jgi:hypothetical protein
MCRLSGRHRDIFYCWANCCQHGSRLLVPPVSGSDNSCGSLGQVPQIEKRHWSHGVAGSICVRARVRVLLRNHEHAPHERGTNPGEVLRSRHAGTATHSAKDARSGETCGRQAPRGSKVWTHESATLAPDSRRIVAFVSLRHDISCGGSVSRAPRVIVSKD